jgi:hypothetical protein
MKNIIQNYIYYINMLNRNCVIKLKNIIALINFTTIIYELILIFLSFYITMFNLNFYFHSP